MLLATRLLTSTCFLSPKARNACVPCPVGIFFTNLGVPVVMSYTSTPSLPVKPINRLLPSGVPNTSAGMAPTGVRDFRVCEAKSMATNSSLSCMVDQMVALLGSIHRWLGVLPVAMRLAKVGVCPSQR